MNPISASRVCLRACKCIYGLHIFPMCNGCVCVCEFGEIARIHNSVRCTENSHYHTEIYPSRPAAVRLCVHVCMFLCYARSGSLYCARCTCFMVGIEGQRMRSKFPPYAIRVGTAYTVNTRTQRRPDMLYTAHSTDGWQHQNEQFRMVYSQREFSSIRPHRHTNQFSRPTIFIQIPLVFC